MEWPIGPVCDNLAARGTKFLDQNYKMLAFKKKKEIMAMQLKAIFFPSLLFPFLGQGEHR